LHSVSRSPSALPSAIDSIRFIPSVGEIVELPFGDAVNAAIRTHPEIAALVFENLENAVVKKPVFCRVSGKSSVFEPHQTAVVTADPERAARVFVKRADQIARQPAVGCKRL
jgi:hypothetical protein